MCLLGIAMKILLFSAHQKFVEASVELGHPFNKDAYSGNNTGIFYSLSSETTLGVRDSSETGYRQSGFLHTPRSSHVDISVQ